MKKLIALFLLGIALTGCNSLNYSGACYANGKPYDGTEALHTECTRYCSILLSGVCKDSIGALHQAENEWDIAVTEKQLKEDKNHAEIVRAARENQLKQDKQHCADFGFADKSEGMANCMMKEQDKRDSASEAAAETAMRQTEEEERSARAKFTASQAAMRQAEQQDDMNRQQYIQRMQERNNQLTRDLQENNNQQMQQIQQRSYQRTPIKNTDFTCMSNCQNAGYQYGLCQSKCSY